MEHQTSQSSSHSNTTTTGIQHQQLFPQYKDITARLKSKTRSLIPSKKVNLQDISQQYTSLASQLAPYSRAYEGHCVLAAARTERLISNSLSGGGAAAAAAGSSSSPPSVAPGAGLGGNTATELQYLLKAARCFRDDAFDCGCHNTSLLSDLPARKSKPHLNDNKRNSLDSAASCYRHAIKICPEPLVPSVLSEMGRMYMNARYFEEAARHWIEGGFFSQAASAYIQVDNHTEALLSYLKVPYKSLSQDDMVTMYLLKLAANDIHVIQVVDNEEHHDPHHGVQGSSSSSKAGNMRMRRVTSINLPESFVSINFPVIPLVLPQDEIAVVEPKSRSNSLVETSSSQQQATVISSSSSSAPPLVSRSVSGGDNYPGTRKSSMRQQQISGSHRVLMTTTRTESKSSSSSSSFFHPFSKNSNNHHQDYRESMLLMNEDTLTLNILLESLYYFLKEYGSGLRILLNSCSQEVRRRVSARRQRRGDRRRVNTTTMTTTSNVDNETCAPGVDSSSSPPCPEFDEEEEEEEEEEDDFEVEEDVEEEEAAGNKETRNLDREARDQLFDQLFSVLRHEDHRKLVFYLMMPPSSY